jgi:hypothetical protein
VPDRVAGLGQLCGTSRSEDRAAHATTSGEVLVRGVDDRVHLRAVGDVATPDGKRRASHGRTVAAGPPALLGARGRGVNQ